MFGDFEVIENLDSFKYDAVAVSDVTVLLCPRSVFAHLVHPVVPVRQHGDTRAHTRWGCGEALGEGYICCAFPFATLVVE